MYQRSPFKIVYFNVNFRLVDQYGDIYEGGYNLGNKHGKGKKIFYEDGRTEIGNWVGDRLKGEFDCIYKDGTVERKRYRYSDEVDQ